jgi:hypothetical protein
MVAPRFWHALRGQVDNLQDLWFNLLGIITALEWFENFQVKWKKPDTNGHILHNSNCMNCIEGYQDRKKCGFCRLSGERSGEWLNGYRWWSLGVIKYLELDNATSCTVLHIYQKLLNDTFKMLIFLRWGLGLLSRLAGLKWSFHLSLPNS